MFAGCRCRLQRPLARQICHEVDQCHAFLKTAQSIFQRCCIGQHRCRKVKLLDYLTGFFVQVELCARAGVPRSQPYCRVPAAKWL